MSLTTVWGSSYCLLIILIPATKRIDSETVFFSLFSVFYATAPYNYRSLYGIEEKSVLLATVPVSRMPWATLFIICDLLRLKLIFPSSNNCPATQKRNKYVSTTSQCLDDNSVYWSPRRENQRNQPITFSSVYL